jgi:hypothetical protein
MVLENIFGIKYIRKHSVLPEIAAYTPMIWPSSKAGILSKPMAQQAHRQGHAYEDVALLDDCPNRYWKSPDSRFC